MKKRFCDFEVYTNWWALVYYDLTDDINEDNVRNKQAQIRSELKVVTSDESNARDKMLDLFLERDTVILGYNIKGYDLIIANAIYQGFSPAQVHMISEMIINESMRYIDAEHIRLAPFAVRNRKLPHCVYQDLLDDNEGSLKEKESIMQLDIKETDVPFDKVDLTDEDKDNILLYCKQDVYASIIYYFEVYLGYVNNKLNLAAAFNVPEEEAYTLTNALVVSRALGAKRQSFSDENDVHIELPEKIKDYIYDNLPANVINHVCNSTGQMTVKLFNNKVIFADGGLHSTLSENLYIEENDEYMLINNDADAYYPSSMLSFGCLTRSIPDPDLFRHVLDERIRIKRKTSEKTSYEQGIVKAYKLICNTTYGASGNKYLPLYDPYMRSKICRIDQLFLAALASKLQRLVPNLSVIQTNTDATMLYFPRKYYDMVLALAQEWTNLSGITMEQDTIHRIWQRDVNNYLEEKTGGAVKRKGAWLTDSILQPGYYVVRPVTAMVSAKAAIEYLLYEKNPIQYILDDKDIFDFVITTKKGPTFNGVVHRMSDGSEIPLNKCNRIVATIDTSLGCLYKYKDTSNGRGYTKMPNAPEHCRVMNNDLTTYDWDDWRKDIDYAWYISRVSDLLDLDFKELIGTDIYRTDRFKF